MIGEIQTDSIDDDLFRLQVHFSHEIDAAFLGDLKVGPQAGEQHVSRFKGGLLGH